MSASTAGPRFLGVGRTASCPTCGAGIYEHCKKPDGSRRSSAHATRVRKAHSLDLAPQMARDLGGIR